MAARTSRAMTFGSKSPKSPVGLSGVEYADQGASVPSSTAEASVSGAEETAVPAAVKISTSATIRSGWARMYSRFAVM